jgi:hypothetical protein
LNKNRAKLLTRLKAAHAKLRVEAET